MATHLSKDKPRLNRAGMTGPLPIERNPFSSILLLCLCLGALIAWSFAPLLRAGFIDLDDDLYVTANDHVRAGLAWPSVKWAFSSTEATNWHPLTWLAHSLDCQLFGLQPWGHHLMSLLIHGLNAWLVFLLFTRMTGALWRSFFVAALFAIHPLHVESVAWIAERKDVLSTLFFLLTLWAYCRFVEKRRTAEGGWLWYGSALLCFVLGLMSKPMLVTLPFVLLLLDYWPFQRGAVRQTQSERPPGSKLSAQSQTWAWGRLVLEKLPFFFLSAISRVVTFLVQQKGGAVAHVIQLPVSLRLENALVSYARYLGKTVWPADLAIFYPHPGRWSAWSVVFAAAPVFGLTLLAWRSRGRRPYAWVGWLWFLGTLVPVIGLVQVGRQAMADRYTYIPLLGVFVIVAWSAQELLGTWHYRSVAWWAAGGALIGLCAISTRRQAGYWRDNETLWTHAAAVTRNNFLAYNNLGLVYEKQGRLDEAALEFQEVVRLRPEDAETRGNLANVYCRQGRIERGLAEYEEAARLKPESAEVHHNLGVTLCIAGRYEEGITHFKQVVKLRPQSASAQLDLAMAWLQKGSRPEAIVHLRKALELQPDYHPAQEQLQALTRQ
ncbi:MAG TPA: tetratricopeptide repeat protein [Verrucomicrobiae bacterium]|nr:tetratricopeptide repeat protein [Verrucomicrobiae bacterium]